MTLQKDGKILVIKLGALGDFVQALGPMAAIRRHHPDAHITLLTTAPYEMFGRGCGYFDDIWLDRKPRWHDLAGWKNLRAQLNAGRFTRVYDLQNNDRTSFYMRLFSTRPEWVGAARGASHRNASQQRIAGKAFEGHVQTLALAGINDISLDDLSWVDGDIGKFHLPRRYALLIPGSAPQRPEKRWPAERFADIANLIDRQGIHPVIVGAAAEDDVAQAICRLHPRAKNLAGRTSLFDVVLLARHAAAAIGNDTGPMHLIAATGCPSHVLFSRHSDPVRHAPAGEFVAVIQKPELNDLGAEDVLRALRFRDHLPLQKIS